jgi:hypothetical protein
VVGFCEHVNELSTSVNVGNCYLFKIYLLIYNLW